MNVNGYRIIYIPSTKDITSIHAYVKTGNMCEISKEAGISHLLEHTIIDSWEHCKGNCTDYWSKKGVISNAHTLALYTTYYIVGLTKEMENMINYVASIITNPKFDTKCVERSKQAIKDELLIRINNPEWKLYHTFFSSIADDTSTNGFGRISDYPLHINNLAHINKKCLYDYYDKWYRSNNIFFVVVSNQPINKINTCFEKYLHKRPLLENIIEPKLKCVNCTSIYYRETAEKTSYVLGFINNNQHPNDYIYYQLVQDMLTGDTASLLYRILRDKLNLVYGIKLIYDVTSSYVLSMFEVNCQFSNSEKLINALLDILKHFVAGKYDMSLLNRSKERLRIMDMNSCRDNTEYLSLFYANQYMMSKKVNLTPDEYINTVNKITKNKLNAVIRRLFQFDKMIIVCETKKNNQ